MSGGRRFGGWCGATPSTQSGQRRRASWRSTPSPTRTNLVRSWVCTTGSSGRSGRQRCRSYGGRTRACNNRGSSDAPTWSCSRAPHRGTTLWGRRAKDYRSATGGTSCSNGSTGSLSCAKKGSSGFGSVSSRSSRLASGTGRWSSSHPVASWCRCGSVSTCYSVSAPARSTSSSVGDSGGRNDASTYAPSYDTSRS